MRRVTIDNVTIGMPERIEDDIEDFKIDAVEDEKDYTVFNENKSRIKLPKLIEERSIDELL